VVSESAHIGRGAVIFPGCYVSSSVQIGLNVAIVAGSTIGHDTVLADHAVISGHVNVGGACTIGSESFIGMGSQIKAEHAHREVCDRGNGICRLRGYSG
jgi:UDP-3-O-[3-hydroxymyristoyl] glucosamine N-acyltransferase